MNISKSFTRKILILKTNRSLATNVKRLCVGVAQLITKLQNTKKMTTNNETPKNDFNATSHKTDVTCRFFCR